MTERKENALSGDVTSSLGNPHQEVTVAPSFAKDETIHTEGAIDKVNECNYNTHHNLSIAPSITESPVTTPTTTSSPAPHVISVSPAISSTILPSSSEGAIDAEATKKAHVLLSNPPGEINRRGAGTEDGKKEDTKREDTETEETKIPEKGTSSSIEKPSGKEDLASNTKVDGSEGRQESSLLASSSSTTSSTVRPSVSEQQQQKQLQQHFSGIESTSSLPGGQSETTSVSTASGSTTTRKKKNLFQSTARFFHNVPKRILRVMSLGPKETQSNESVSPSTTSTASTTGLDTPTADHHRASQPSTASTKTQQSRGGPTMSSTNQPARSLMAKPGDDGPTDTKLKRVVSKDETNQENAPSTTTAFSRLDPVKAPITDITNTLKGTKPDGTTPEGTKPDGSNTSVSIREIDAAVKSLSFESVSSAGSPGVEGPGQGPESLTGDQASISSSTQSYKPLAPIKPIERPRRSPEEDAVHERFTEAALDMACLALRTNETPVGCVLVHEGKIIASGMNATNISRNGTRHAEFMAISALLSLQQPDHKPLSEEVVQARVEHSKEYVDATKDLKEVDIQTAAAGHLYPYGQKWYPATKVDAEIVKECSLYVTVEPCVMCASFLRQLGIKKVYFGAVNDKFGGTGGVFHIHVNSNDKCLPPPSLGPEDGAEPEPTAGDGGMVEPGFIAEGGWGRDEAVALLRRFYVQENGRAPVPRKKEGRAARLAALEGGGDTGSLTGDEGTAELSRSTSTLASDVGNGCGSGTKGAETRSTVGGSVSGMGTLAGDETTETGGHGHGGGVESSLGVRERQQATLEQETVSVA